MYFFSFVSACIFSSVVAWYDIRTQTIPNKLSLVAFLTIGIGGFVTSSTAWELHMLSLFIAFIFFFGCFSFGLLGGGDAKYIIALSPLFPLQEWFWWIFFVFVSGGIQALLTLRYYRLHHPKHRPKTIPYGLAICLGTWGYFFFSL